MRIGIVGKGGSGKTTISALFARAAVGRVPRVVVIDADINQQLGSVLGFSDDALAATLAQRSNDIRSYIVGTNTRYTPATLVKTTPPGTGSRGITVTSDFFSSLSTSIDGLHVLRVGEISDEDVGIRCYHAKTGVLELLLTHLIDRDDEIILVDMTAGADTFASGLFTKFDALLVVVEPTLQSVSVYDQFVRHSKPFNIPVLCVVNKEQDSEDEAFIHHHVPEDAIIGTIPYSVDFKVRNQRGKGVALDQIEGVVRAALEELIHEIAYAGRDWEKMYRDAVSFHEKNAVSWANAAMGFDVCAQIDPEFSMSSWVERHIAH